MNRNYFIPVILCFLGIVIVFLLLKILTVNRIFTGETQRINIELARMEDSIDLAHKVIDSLKDQTPGLGEYMSAIQLHISKIWFAGKVSNWDLAKYELNELREAVDGARALHVFRNTVNISAVLESVEQTQLLQLEQTMKVDKSQHFLNTYNQTISACNGCHQSAGYKFIHIIVPKSEPVTNQQWKAGD
jgi:hypothetical protein